MRNLLFLLLITLSGSNWAAECPRIISQSPYITHTLQWMGLEACIVGTSRYDNLGLPTTGGILDPDTDAIASLFPDLLFTTDWVTEEKARSSVPTGTRVYRLHGFQTMAQIEENIRVIAEATGQHEGNALADKFHQSWTQRIGEVRGDSRRVLLISSCSGSPYSFGRETWLYDLFTRAGFQVVETHKNIRHIRAGEEVAVITDLVDTLKPELLFIFERSGAQQCQLITPKLPITIVKLDGAALLQPAPVLLEGIDQLLAARPQWQ